MLLLLTVLACADLKGHLFSSADIGTHDTASSIGPS